MIERLKKATHNKIIIKERTTKKDEKAEQKETITGKKHDKEIKENKRKRERKINVE